MLVFCTTRKGRQTKINDDYRNEKHGANDYNYYNDHDNNNLNNDKKDYTQRAIMNNFLE